MKIFDFQTLYRSSIASRLAILQGGMMVKRRFKLVLIGSSFAVLVIILVCFVMFTAKTMSTSDAYRYCINNTAVGATSFTRYGISSEPSYAFWVAEDGVSDLQELFIFRLAPFFRIESTTRWNRFSFVYHASTGLDEIVGSVMFTPRDSKNQKKTTNIIAFYSSNKYNISRHIITVEENGKRYTEETGSSTSQPFVTFVSVGVRDGVSRKFIKAEFFDAEGNLVKTITGN